MHVTIPKCFPWSGGDGRSGRTEQRSLRWSLSETDPGGAGLGKSVLLLTGGGLGQVLWLQREVRCPGGYARLYDGDKKLKGDVRARQEVADSGLQ